MQVTERKERETARDYALRILKENIISLDLAPGSMVSENEISLKLGLSRTPVREALIELNRANIVEIYPQKGSKILLIDYTQVEESRFLRLVLERAVVMLLCSREEVLDFSVLEENLKLQQFYLDNPNPEKLLELDDAFHFQLFRLADKTQSYDWMIKGLSVHFDRVRSMSLNTIKDIQIVSDHTCLLKAIREKDSDAALACIDKHLSRYKVDEQLLREKYPTYFSS